MIFIAPEVAHIIRFQHLVFAVRYQDIDEDGIRLNPYENGLINASTYYMYVQKKTWTIFEPENRYMEAYGDWPQFEDVEDMDPYFLDMRPDGSSIRQYINSQDGLTMYALTQFSKLFILDRS